MEQLIDPDYHAEGDVDLTPSTLAQSLIGGSIMLTIALAFYGAAMIAQSIQHTIMGLQ